MTFCFQSDGTRDSVDLFLPSVMCFYKNDYRQSSWTSVVIILSVFTVRSHLLPFDWQVFSFDWLSFCMDENEALIVRSFEPRCASYISMIDQEKSSKSKKKGLASMFSLFSTKAAVELLPIESFPHLVLKGLQSFEKWSGMKLKPAMYQKWCYGKLFEK